MMTNNEWLAMNVHRANIYEWFGALFALEQTEEQLRYYKRGDLAPLFELLTNLELNEEVERLQSAIATLNLEEYGALELSSDFAQHFLLDEKVSTLPYASFYLEDGRLYGDVETKMREFLLDNALAVTADFKEPADHLAVYLQLMAHWIRNDNDFTAYRRIDAEQALFLQQGLLSWLPEFTAQSQKQRLKYDFYPALSALLLSFVTLDVQLLES